MPTKTKPIPEEIKDYLSYNPETGELTWKKAPRFNINKGSKAGTIDKYGHLKLSFKGKKYFAHRVAYYLYHGNLDTKLVVDHINHNKTDNRIENLRAVTKQGNTCHQSQLKGAYQYRGKWCASIKLNYKNKHLGTFNTEEEAREAYLQAKRVYHSETCSHY